jgi:hypothetical protein
MEVKLNQLTEMNQFRKKEVKKSAAGWRRMTIDQLIAEIE